jgi:hypothetical protein
MRAAVVPGFGQPLVIEDRPVPEYFLAEAAFRCASDAPNLRACHA